MALSLDTVKLVTEFENVKPMEDDNILKKFRNVFGIGLVGELSVELIKDIPTDKLFQAFFCSDAYCDEINEVLLKASGIRGGMINEVSKYPSGKKRLL